MKTFGERLYFLRQKNGLSQMELAKKIGSSKGTIQNYESNMLPKGEYAIKLAKFFKCSIDWLLTGEELINKDAVPNEIPHTKGDIKSISNNSNLTKLIIEHQDVVKRFKNPQKAKDINEDLIELEALDEALYEDVAKHIKSSVNAARVIKGAAKKNQRDNTSEEKQASGE